MSLIADALRKIETPGASLPSQEPKPPSLWPYRILLGTGIALVLGLLVAVTQKGSSHPASTTPPAPPTAFSPVTKVSPSALLFNADRQMSLSGIITGSGKSLAVINNQLVEEGEMIRGMKLVRVMPDQIELEKEGRVTTLKLKN